MGDARSRVLLMDDEIGTADIVRYAVEGLEDAGFEVTVVSQMSAATSAFYERYFHVFVLDVDMSLVQDVQEGSGTDLGRFLRSLDASANVIVFSARGEVSDWFAAANHHLLGYVDKGEPDAIAKLVELASLGREAGCRSPSVGRRESAPEHALFALATPCRVTPSVLMTAVEEALPGWEVEVVDSLAEVGRRVADSPETYGVVGAFADAFPAHPTVLRQARELCGAAPRPHAVLGSLGRPESRPSLLGLVCARPFRLVDLALPDLPARLSQALSGAAAHYDRWELLAADRSGLRRLKLEFPESVLARMHHDDDDEDEGETLGELGP